MSSAWVAPGKGHTLGELCEFVKRFGPPPATERWLPIWCRKALKRHPAQTPTDLRIELPLDSLKGDWRRMAHEIWEWSRKPATKPSSGVSNGAQS
jgi:hypothetical protein